MNRTILAFVFCVFLFSQVIVAQTASRTIGVTASIQSDQLDFSIPIWVSQTAVIAPNLGVVSAGDIGTDLTLGMALKNYFRETTGAVPFASLRAGTIAGIPKDGDTIYDFIFGAGFGGEYFFDPQFSLGIEIQGNLSISDEGSFRFGNPGEMNFNTATALTASIYF